jgi:hypothetical protein
LAVTAVATARQAPTEGTPNSQVLASKSIMQGYAWAKNLLEACPDVLWDGSYFTTHLTE